MTADQPTDESRLDTMEDVAAEAEDRIEAAAETAGKAENDIDRLLAECRMVEAILFAATRPLSLEDIRARLPEDVDVPAHLETLSERYKTGGFNLISIAGKWQFRTAPDLGFLLREEVEESRRLSRAGVETLAIIAYHQPVTRAEIEELRGVSLSKGTLDVLIEAGWVRPRGRKQVPGRPVLYATTEEFLVHFGLERIGDLPGLEELKAAGLLDPIDMALENMMKQGQKPDAEDSEEDEDAVEDAEAAPLAASEAADFEYVDAAEAETPPPANDRGVDEEDWAARAAGAEDGDDNWSDDWDGGEDEDKAGPA